MGRIFGEIPSASKKMQRQRVYRNGSMIRVSWNSENVSFAKRDGIFMVNPIIVGREVEPPPQRSRAMLVSYDMNQEKNIKDR